MDTNKGDIATIGITDFAQGELGDIVYVEIEKVGKFFQKRKSLVLLRLSKLFRICLCH